MHNRKHHHCPWSTAQIRERVNAKIITEFGHRRGYERMCRSDREIVAKATAWEAICEHVENARRYDPGTGTSDQPAGVEASEQAGTQRILALSVAGQTLGVIETKLDKAADGTWTTHERVTFSMTRQGGGADATFNTLSESITIYDPQHEFVSEVETEQEAGITITRRVRLEQGKIISEYEGPDRKTSREYPVPADYRSSLQVYFELLAKWRETGEPQSASYSSFSSERERFDTIDVTFLGEATYQHGDKALPGYSLRERSEDGTVITTITDHDFLPMTLDESMIVTSEMIRDTQAAIFDAFGLRDDEEI